VVWIYLVGRTTLANDNGFKCGRESRPGANPVTVAWWPPAGLAQGMDLPTTVMPFILRGVTLAGI